MELIETKHNILKLIKEAEAQFSGTGKALLDIEDYVAEYLTANGVIVPPVKVGQTVYVITDCSRIIMYHDNDYFTGTGAIECPFEFACNFSECNDENTQVLETCVRFLFCDDYGDWTFELEHINMGYKFDEIGKTVFLSREDAEKALEERKEK